MNNDADVEEALSSFGNADGQDAILFAEPRELLVPMVWNRMHESRYCHLDRPWFIAALPRRSPCQAVSQTHD